MRRCCFASESDFILCCCESTFLFVAELTIAYISDKKNLGDFFRYDLRHLVCVLFQKQNSPKIDKYAYFNHYENVIFICFNNSNTVCIRYFLFPFLKFTPAKQLRWLEIVSWRARPGSLIARARASTPGSRRCKFSDLVPSKILQNLYFDRKYLGKMTVKICKILHSGKERTEISVLIERKTSVRSKQNERENRII